MMVTQQFIRVVKENIGVTHFLLHMEGVKDYGERLENFPMILTIIRSSFTMWMPMVLSATVLLMLFVK
jgi:hypothetical protein